MAIIHPERLVDLALELQSFATNVAEAMDGEVDLFIVSGLRTDEEQAKLYAKGRTVSSGICVCAHHPLGKVVTNAASAKDTPHGRGAAFDFCPSKNGKLLWEDLGLFEAVGMMAEANGLVWGGRFKHLKGDFGHVELKSWRAPQLRLAQSNPEQKELSDGPKGNNS